MQLDVLNLLTQHDVHPLRGLLGGVAHVPEAARATLLQALLGALLPEQEAAMSRKKARQCPMHLSFQGIVEAPIRCERTEYHDEECHWFRTPCETIRDYRHSPGSYNVCGRQLCYTGGIFQGASYRCFLRPGHVGYCRAGVEEPNGCTGPMRVFLCSPVWE